jgi:hypothetical protein
MSEVEHWAIGLTVDAILGASLFLLMRNWMRWRLHRRRRAVARAFMIKLGFSKDDPPLKSF